jgi:signal transduction histidine kinase/CheY-like chemotaxis protein
MWMLGVCLAAQTPVKLTLEQASSRKPDDHAPAHLGKVVTVRGMVSAPAYHFIDYSVVALQDERGGVALRVPPDDKRLDGLQRGDEVEATGVVVNLAGMPAIEPSQVRPVGRREAPPPERVPIAELQSFRYLGRLVEGEGTVVEAGETTAGAYVLIAAANSGNYKIFLPSGRDRTSSAPPAVRSGDRIRFTGVAFQYCPRAPFNRWFEALIRDNNEITVLDRSWFVPPSMIVAGLAVALLMAYLWWLREQRLAQQRDRLRRIYQLGEEILGVPAIEAILARVSDALPSILGISRVRLYLHNRATKSLESVASEGAESVTVELASPPGGSGAGAAACFHYRTLLSIPDLARSPFPVAAPGAETQPKSMLFVPMLAQGDVVGVLELDQFDRAREFSVDEQSLAQHLGNQIGVAMRLLDQRSVQEQLHRSEKLAAVGRLISGVVSELQTPLSSIVELAALAQQKPHLCPAERELKAIATEARKAESIMARLVSFASEPSETRPVDINALIRTLIDFRGHDCKASGIRIRDLGTNTPLWVIGWQGQLEQVLLNLLVHAEQCTARAVDKTITIQTSLLAKRILIEIGFNAPDEGGPDDSMAALTVARSVIGGHGGEVRLVKGHGGTRRFELELPGNARERSAPSPVARQAGPARQLTVLVIEPDEPAQRHLMAMLSARGCRAVPVNNSDTGLEIAQRMRFDLVFCSFHSPGLNWVELSERLQERIGAFILLSDGYDAELAADFEGEGRHVLAKPVQEPELDRILTPAAAETATTMQARTA